MTTGKAAATARKLAPPGRSRLRLLWKREALPWAFVAPVAILVAIGVLFPLGYVLLLGSQDYSPYLGTSSRYVGLANYRAVFADSAFWRALVASAIWVVGSVVPQFLLGLADKVAPLPGAALPSSSAEGYRL